MAFRLLLVDCILHRGLNAVWCRSSLLFHDRGMDPTESRLSNGSKHKDSLPFFRKSPLSESRSCCKRSWTLSRKLVLAIGTAGRNVPNLMSQLFAETKKGRNRREKKNAAQRLSHRNRRNLLSISSRCTKTTLSSSNGLINHSSYSRAYRRRRSAMLVLVLPFPFLCLSTDKRTTITDCR